MNPISTSSVNKQAAKGQAVKHGTAPRESSGAHPPQMIDVSKSTPESAVEQLISHAVELRASDLFIVSNEQHMAVLVRHLGIVRPISVLSPDQGKRCLSHIKANSGMDMSEKRRPTDGRWIFDPGVEVAGDDEPVDIRINVIPTMYGEDFALRLLSRGNQLYDLEQLGMTSDQLQAYQQMIAAPSGLVLITGPTGSGKTATLYASLKKLNDGRRKINTIEDPIEYAIDGLRQSQVNPMIDLTFSELLRSVLRQSPDVIMIGEIRDEETAKTAVRAANSGMLVFATLHAASAAGAVQSMRSLGTHPHFLSTSLRGVVAQRLARTLCTSCRTSFDISDAPNTFDEVRPWLGAEEGKTLYAPRGCDECNGTGYAGRTGLFEVMPFSKSLRALVADNAPIHEIRAKAMDEKMLDFRSAALLKVARGVTSTEEVFRVIPSEHMLTEE